MTRGWIPVAAADVFGREEEFVCEALRSSWISSTGSFLERFETEFASLCGTTSALAVCNGTVALHLAMLALGVRPGDEVLVPSLTYVATANAVRYVGGEPVFVDVEPETWCMDPVGVEAAITRRTRGIIAVHLLGHPADMDRLNRIAAVNGLWVVEDAAEAHCGKYKGRPTGGLAQLGTFSFFGNKILTCGEGGAVTVNDEALATRLKTLRGQGMDPERRYFFPVTGYNFRLTNVAAAMLCAQMERRDQILARRNEIFAEYKKQLEDIPGISFPPVAEWAEVAPWMFAIQVNAPEFGLSRDGLMRYLKEQGIDTRPMFIPLHTLPMFREGSRQRGEHLPVTEEIAASSIMLPTYNGLTTAELMQVTDSIKKSALERGVRYRRGHSRPLKKVLGSSTFGVPTRPFRHELQLSGDLFNRLLALPEGNREEEAMSSQGQGYTRRPREEGCQVGELTITAVTQGDRKQLGAFFTVLNNDKETATFFHPHPFTSAYADTLCQQAPTRKDRYYLARFRGEVVGYAMLRGWDEGFAVPSFGVCVHPEVRNAGIGRLLLWHALKESKRAGVSSVRLTVYRCNHRAVHVYAQYGFQFKDKDEHSLVGIVDLSEVPEEGPPLIKEVVLGEWLRAQAA